MRTRLGASSAGDDAQQAPRWALLGVLLYLVSSCLLTVQVLRLLARKGERQASLGSAAAARSADRPTVPASRETRGQSRRLAANEEAAFRAGVETAFDVIGVLRELVKEALASSDEEAVGAKSANDHRHWPDPEPQ